MMTLGNRSRRVNLSFFLILGLCGVWAGLSGAATIVESFEDADLQSPWVINKTFGGQPDSVVIRDSLCVFHKVGDEPAFTQSIAMANADKDNRVVPPWSVEYTIPDTAELVAGGGYFCNRFWKPGAPVCDWVYVRNMGGSVVIGAADGSQLYAFPAQSVSLLKIRFDVTVAGLKVYATTDIGSYGQGKDLAWQNSIDESTPVGIDIMATDMYGSSVVGPFNIAIRQLTLTTGALPAETPQAGTETAAGQAAVPRFNPRCERIDSTNMIRNSSFECGDAMWASLGKQTAWGGELSGLFGSVEAGSAWHGQHGLRIDLGPGITPVTCFDAWPPACVHQHAPLASNIGWIPVGKGKLLTLSAYLRSNIPEMKARFLFRFADSALEPVKHATRDVLISQEWTRYTVTQESLGEDVCISVGPDMSDMPETFASCWIDAVQLESGTDATAYKPREAVELGFNTERYGNVYDAGEPPALIVHGTNSQDNDVTIALTVDMEDYFGEPLAPSKFSIRIPANGRSEKRCVLPVPGTGHYRARMKWIANGRQHTQSIVFALIEPYPHDDSPFGLNHPAPSQRQLRHLSKAGLQWVRNWSINWDWVEPAPGEVSWQAQDAQLNHVSSAGLKTLVVFPNPSTNWASSAPASVERKQWFRLAYAPKEPRLLFDFIAHAVDRYKNTCQHWEFLNEALWVPNFCLPQSAGYTVLDYIDLLKGAYKAIKTADPDSLVIAGLAIMPEFTLGDEFIGKGGFAHCDLFNLHPYGGLTVPEEFIAHMERVQGAMDEYGERKSIWATEAAYYGVDEKPWSPWTPPPGHFSAGLLLPDERVCADYIIRQALIMLAHGVVKIFYHEPIEGPVNNGAMDIENTFLSQNAVPKKSYVAIATLANLLGPSPQYVAEVSFPEAASARSACYGYAFQAGQNAVMAVWTPESQKQEIGQAVSVSLASNVAAYNIVGNPISSPIVLGPSPVYLVSTSLEAEQLAAKWFSAN